MLVRRHVGTRQKAPEPPRWPGVGFRGCTAVNGILRVAVSNTCRSSGRRSGRLPASPEGISALIFDRIRQVSSGFEPPFQVRKLPVDAPGVGGQQHGHAVAGPLGDLSGRYAVVEPLGETCVAIVVDPPARRRVEDLRWQHCLPGAAPGATGDGSREDSTVLTLKRRSPGFSCSSSMCCRRMRVSAGCPGTVRVSPSARSLRSRRSWMSPVSVHCLPTSGVAVWITSSHHWSAASLPGSFTSATRMATASSGRDPQ